MKTIKFICSLLCISLLVASFSAVADKRRSLERKTLVIAGDYWCPYNCSQGADKPGYLVELIRRALYIYRIDVEYRMMPWGDALDAVKAGEVDGIIGVSDVRGRKMVSTRLPLEYSVASAYTRADTQWEYDGLESLRGKKLGIIMDYVVDNEINHYVGIHYPTNSGMFVVEDGKNAVIESIANLIDGDSDVYIEDRRVVENYINENGLAPYIRNAGNVTKIKQPIYIAFSSEIPSIKKYIKSFEEGLASLKATGEYDDIRAKYNMD